MRRAIVAAFLLTLAGCQLEPAENRSDAILQRMVDQDRCTADDLTRHFGSGSCDQQPPRDVVPFGAPPPTPISTGSGPDGKPLQGIPLHVDDAFIRRGQQRFNVFCATCHGLLGDGQSEVAENMQLRKPPAFFETRIRALPDGRVFQVISQGYGLMPGYGHALPVEQRWAVVAYVRVLALSQRMPLAALTPAAREEALRWLQ
jgi:mono/diheme cytochrome c family protein